MNAGFVFKWFLGMNNNQNYSVGVKSIVQKSRLNCLILQITSTYY